MALLVYYDCKKGCLKVFVLRQDEQWDCYNYHGSIPKGCKIVRRIMGLFLETTAAFFAALLAAILTVLIAVMTNVKFYVTEEPKDIVQEDKLE